MVNRERNCLKAAVGRFIIEKKQQKGNPLCSFSAFQYLKYRKMEPPGQANFFRKGMEKA